jgi:glycosyl transferase family 25
MRVSIFTGYMMKCYLINLDRSPDRLAQMRVEFERLGLTFIRVAAVDGKQLSQEELDAVTPRVRHWEIPMPSSEIGCFLSHRKCFEIIANGDDNYAAVFEDDIILSNETRKVLSNTDWIPEDADIIKIETFSTVILLDASQEIAGTACKYGRLLSKHLCTGGYIISRNAARQLLTFMDQVSIPVDNLMFDPAYKTCTNFTIYQIHPALCKQEGFESLIEVERKMLRRQFIKRPSLPGLIVREIRRSYNRSSHILSPSKLWTRLTSKKRWMRVQFRPQD